MNQKTQRIKEQREVNSISIFIPLYVTYKICSIYISTFLYLPSFKLYVCDEYKLDIERRPCR